jgi:HTH-type transcriptional regulator/antitoxin HigA
MPNTIAATPSKRPPRKPPFSDSEYRRLLSEIMPRPIRTAAENEAAIEMVQRLDAGTPEQQALGELMTVLIEDFEERHYPILRAEPRVHLRQLMEERGHTQVQVANAMASSRGAVSDILSGRRSVSKSHATKLAAFYRVPVELFL